VWYDQLCEALHMYGEIHAQLCRLGHHDQLPEAVLHGSDARATARYHLDHWDEGHAVVTVSPESPD